jgi:hypothetical protein
MAEPHLHKSLTEIGQRSALAAEQFLQRGAERRQLFIVPAAKVLHHIMYEKHA